MAIKFIYTLFLGILLALFVGLGIAAFYPAPHAPEYPVDTVAQKPDLTGTYSPSPEYLQQQEEYRKQSDEYTKNTFPRYNRNVSIVSVIAAVLALVISLTMIRKIELISDGLLLGGVFLLGYGIIRGFMSENNVLLLFIVTTVGLIAAVTVGYVKFVRERQPEKK